METDISKEQSERDNRAQSFPDKSDPWACLVEAHLALLKQFNLLEGVDKIIAQKLYYYLNFILLNSPFNQELYVLLNSLFLKFYDSLC